MTTASGIRAGGFAVFWCLGATNRKVLKDQLDAIGYGCYLPEMRSPYAAMLSAARHVYTPRNDKDRHFMPRGTKNEEAVDVVVETLGENGKNAYSHWDTLAWDAITKQPMDCLDFDIVNREYEHQRSILHSTSVTNMLVKLVCSVGGVTLRPEGGFYWIPERRRERWEKIVAAVHMSGMPEDPNHLYALNLVYDDAMRNAVIASLVREIEADVKKMNDKLAVTGDDALGKRALETRKDLALQLTKKVQEYEEMLGVAQTELRKRLDEVMTRAATLVLEVAAGDGKVTGGTNPIDSMFGA